MKHKLPYIITLISLFIVALGSVLFFTLYPRLVFEYSDTYKGYLVVDAKGISSEFTIPKTYKDKDVVGIGERAFYKNNKLEKIVFEDKNIKVIEKLAFSECTNLVSIDLSGVKNIERNAFSYDAKLDNINLECLNLGSSAFFGCESLKNITLGNNLKTIGSFAFSKSIIETITLPKTLEVLAYDTFSDMAKLKEINIYKSSLKEGINYLNSLESVKINNLSN